MGHVLLWFDWMQSMSLPSIRMAAHLRLVCMRALARVSAHANAQTCVKARLRRHACLCARVRRCAQAVFAQGFDLLGNMSLHLLCIVFGARSSNIELEVWAVGDDVALT